MCPNMRVHEYMSMIVSMYISMNSKELDAHVQWNSTGTEETERRGMQGVP